MACHFASACFDEFLTHLDNYRLVAEDFLTKWHATTELSREQKIAEFKLKKQMEAQIKLLEERGDPDELRELYEDRLKLCAQQSLDHLRFAKLELQMLQMKADRVEPPPPPPPSTKPQFVQIDASNIGMMPSVISSGQDLAEIRESLKARVFQPGHNLPTMTVEEFGELELKRMEEQQQQKPPEPPEEDSDQEDVAEEQRKKAADWDDWKDAHEIERDRLQHSSPASVTW